jgi:hypothetical protein
MPSFATTPRGGGHHVTGRELENMLERRLIRRRADVLCDVSHGVSEVSHLHGHFPPIGG